jgi:Na+:H+ antiporter, NhaA family
MDIFKSSFKILREFSAFLLFGTVLALIWANAGPQAAQLYNAFVEAPLAILLQDGLRGGIAWYEQFYDPAGHPLNFKFIVNDIFMVLFFGIAAKEVSQAFLPGGSLDSLKKAAVPGMATAGGVLGPIAVFFALHAAFGLHPDVARAAWAVPTATDIAYCWLFAGLIFGRAHPAVTFLLVIAVLDDLIGMGIIAVYYTPHVEPQWLGLVALAVIICEVMRRNGVKNFWPYVLVGGPLAWFGLYLTGVHAALALVPIVPFMPHGERDAGLFEVAAESTEAFEEDTMDRFEHFFMPIVDVGLLGFGLVNAGVVLSGESLRGGATWAVFGALLIGKTAGIGGFSWLGSKLGLKLPAPMKLSHTVVVGAVAGVGFTVALFVATIGLSLAGAQGWQYLIEHPEVGDMLKLGAILSFAAGPIAMLLGWLLKIEKIHPRPGEAAGH